MLEFAPDITELKLKQLWLFPEQLKGTIVWPIESSHTRTIIPHSEVKASLQKTTRFTDWKWPKKNIHFISDIHADADALMSSLVWSGCIKKTGIKNSDFLLTTKGKNAQIVIGGDCLDKGPCNLKMLRTLASLIRLKKNTILLAGNHDIRLYMGLKTLVDDQPHSKHFFVRMGTKVIPLLREIYDEYLRETQTSHHLPSVEQCRKHLFPAAGWYKSFHTAVHKSLAPEVIDLEVRKIKKKWSHFEANCDKHGLSLPMVYLAARKCYSLFMQPEGEFYWFFNKMQLIHREKSFLFTHAGLDDKISQTIEQSGVKQVNKLYKRLLQKNLCDFYYGEVANLLRTKYRKTDPMLTGKGVKRMHRKGIHAVVHGHVSQTDGQHISFRSGMLHFECDITLDRNSRVKQGLSGFGAGVTTIDPAGRVTGISADSQRIKIFQPEMFF